MEVIIDLREMENYRIMTLQTRKAISMAHGNFVKLVHERNDPDLEKIMWGYVNAMMPIDFAHKVLCVNGRPVEHARYAEQYIKEISHRPRRRKATTVTKKRRCPDYLKLVHSSPARKQLRA